jgi:hypothetical protein
MGGRVLSIFKGQNLKSGLEFKMAGKHDSVARRLAGMYGTNYNAGPGADIIGPGVTIEVETDKSVSEAGRQLQGHHGPVYVAGTTVKAVEKALERYAGSTIGVMDESGNIRKQSTRR